MVIMDFKEKELSENKKSCTDCKTTKTPLWRGGPAGPKTLCNACGIRYRKRRACTVGLNKKGQERKRDKAQSRGGGGGGAANGTSTTTTDSATSTTTSTTSSAETVGVGGSDLRESLKMKLMALGEEVLLQRSPSVVKKKQRRMLGEEEQAAVCLMALSCGFVFA